MVYEVEPSIPMCASLSWRRARTGQRLHTVKWFVTSKTRFCLKATPNDKSTRQEGLILADSPSPLVQMWTEITHQLYQQEKVLRNSTKEYSEHYFEFKENDY